MNVLIADDQRVVRMAQGAVMAGWGFRCEMSGIEVESWGWPGATEGGTIFAPGSIESDPIGFFDKELQIMPCPRINTIQFDKSSLDALNDIRRRRNLTIVLSRLMPYGTMANIFLGNGALKSAYNISTTDFETLGRAMAALPPIERKVIRDIATMEALSHTGKQAEFWKGVVDGCEIN